MIQNETDFLMGIAWASIINGFSSTYFNTYQKLPSLEEMGEISKVVQRRMAEIKKAIFDAG